MDEPRDIQSTQGQETEAALPSRHASSVSLLQSTEFKSRGYKIFKPYLRFRLWSLRMEDHDEIQEKKGRNVQDLYRQQIKQRNTARTIFHIWHIRGTKGTNYPTEREDILRCTTERDGSLADPRIARQTSGQSNRGHIRSESENHRRYLVREDLEECF